MLLLPSLFVSSISSSSKDTTVNVPDLEETSNNISTRAEPNNSFAFSSAIEKSNRGSGESILLSSELFLKI